MPADERRIRVLLIAEACNPDWTSVPLLAYYWYRAIRTFADVTLVTQVRNRQAFVRRNETEKVVFIDSEAVASPLHKFGRAVTLGHPTALGSRSAVSWLAYLYFEHLVWRRFRGQLCRGDFDLVHRLTPLSPIFPSPIAQYCPVPFVLGPLNGALPWPPGTRLIRKQEGEWLSILRPACHMLPFWRQTFERASRILVGGKHVRRDIPHRLQARVSLLAENGVDTDLFKPRCDSSGYKPNPFTILFVGRLLPLKQPTLILDAVARLSTAASDIRIVYAGEGSERDAIVHQARKHKLERQVHLLGNVPHTQLPQHYQSASVLALPSIHESGGAVLLEAMACGLPCIVANYGGPSEYVTDQTGFRVPLGDPIQMANGFARALAVLKKDSTLLRRMSSASRAHILARYTWNAKAHQLKVIYESGSHRDDLAMTITNPES